MKKTLLASCFLLLCLTSSAQITHTPNGTVDQGASKILKAVADKWAKASFKFDVTLVNYDANRKESFRQKAQITYKSPRYMVKAGDIEIYCDGQDVWQVNKKASEVVITKMSTSDDDLTNPASLLANYSKNYRPKFIREENGVAIIDMQPKKGKQYHKLRLFIDTVNNRIKKIEQHNYDSSRGEYTFSNYTLVNVNPEAFKYSVPKGYEVIDMR